MKNTLLIGIALMSFNLNAQTTSNATTKNTIETTSITETNYSEVDNYVLGLKKQYTSISELSKDLTDSFSTQDEKVRAIFRWMTDNISYDCKLFHDNGKIPGLRVKDYYSMREYYYAYAEHVLKTKKGICEGYAQLFYQLCKASGIKCYLVTGIASNHPATVRFFRAIKMFNSDHAWNKVMIDEKWYYVDATWASGYCNPLVTHFTKQFNQDYYLTPENEPYPTHAEEKTESADRNDLINNYNYPKHIERRPFLNIFYCTDW